MQSYRGRAVHPWDKISTGHASLLSTHGIPGNRRDWGLGVLSAAGLKFAGATPMDLNASIELRDG